MSAELLIYRAQFGELGFRIYCRDVGRCQTFGCLEPSPLDRTGYLGRCRRHEKKERARLLRGQETRQAARWEHAEVHESASVDLTERELRDADARGDADEVDYLRGYWLPYQRRRLGRCRRWANRERLRSLRSRSVPQLALRASRPRERRSSRRRRVSRAGPDDGPEPAPALAGSASGATG